VNLESRAPDYDFIHRDDPELKAAASGVRVLFTSATAVDYGCVALR